MEKPRIRVPAGSMPVAVPARPAPRAQDAAPAPYQTGGSGPRSRSFRPGDHGPNAALVAAATLRRQARQLRRNSDMIETVINKLGESIIGTGIVPELADEAAQTLWTRWTDVADADGASDFYGQCLLAVEEMAEAGECFIRRRVRRPGDGLEVPLQLQLLASEMVPIDMHRPRDARGLVTRHGIQFDAIGRRVGYWVYPVHPGEGAWGGAEPVLVPASEIAHLYRPKRAGQIRGITWLSPMLGKIKDMEDVQDSTRLREANQANFNTFVIRPAPAQADIDTLMGHWSSVDARDRDSALPRVGMEPGATWILEPGEDVKFANPPGVAGTYEPFIRMQARGIAAAARLLYEQVSGDYSQVNDRMWRAAHNEFRRGVEAIQHHQVVFQLLRPVLQWWGALARLAGRLPAGVNTDLVTWTPQAWPYINPVQDVQAAQGEIRAGLSSRTRKLRERGERAAEIDRENAGDRARETDAGLVYTTDPGKVSNAGVTQSRPADNELPDA